MAAAAITQQSDPSTRNHLDTVLENELDQLQQRVLQNANGEFFFYLTGSAREFLLLKGTEQRHGANCLKLAIERHIVVPLADLVATDQIQVGDLIRIDRDCSQPSLTFTHKGKDRETPARRCEPDWLVGYVPARAGKSGEVLGL
jgi:ATP-dependent Clp protease ATP-binding subunit ClpA